MGNQARAAIIRSQQITGLNPEVIAELVAEISPLWHERHQAALVPRPRRRAVGAGAKHKLVFVDRLLATPVDLRHGATHDVLACWFGVDRSGAIGPHLPQTATRLDYYMNLAFGAVTRAQEEGLDVALLACGCPKLGYCC